MQEIHNDFFCSLRKSEFVWKHMVLELEQWSLCASTEVSSRRSASELLHESVAAKCNQRRVTRPGSQFPNQAPSVLLMYTDMST